MLTPWGQSDHESKLIDGVVFYGTPGHGGYKVDASVRATWPQPLQDFVPFNDNTGWYEEDCDAAIVMLAHHEHFPTSAIDCALRTAEILAKDDDRWKAIHDFASKQDFAKDPAAPKGTD
jgi:hypothetical protein